MDAKDWNEKEVFLQALSLPPAQRDAFLESHCPNPQAIARVRALLLHQQQAPDEFLSITIPPPDAPRHPEKVDEFRILHRLGEGGMGIVYLAEDSILNRRVAIKILARSLTGSAPALARFRDEARNAAGLKHPAIVPVFKFGHDGELHYIVSEFVEGRTLAALIGEKKGPTGRLSFEDAKSWYRQAAEIVATIADALDCAHKANIVHRDVKPSNILVDRDRGPRLTDFGIAKHLTVDERTQPTGVIGSCHYMSPEQAGAVSLRIDQRSDIFSLGVVLYEMLALRLPFEGTTIPLVLKAVMEVQPPRLRMLDRRIPTDLETICHKAIEKRPQDRYQTAAHVAADLRCWLVGDPILASPPGPGKRARRWIRRHRTAVATSGVAFLIITIASLIALLRYTAGERQAWIAVDADAGPCQVFVQMVDPASCELIGTARPIGTTPLNARNLASGQYRVTVVSDDGKSMSEFNLLASKPGRANITTLRVHKNRNYKLTAFTDGSPRTLFGSLANADAADLSEMVLIPAGIYPCGENGNRLPQFRRKTLTLPAFLIDKTEVTNRQYKRFVDAANGPAPSQWSEFPYDESLADRPVVGLKVEEAEAYARWLGKRLPTMFEWQAATRGVAGHKYPWGDSLASAPSPIPSSTEGLDLLHSGQPSVHYGLYCKYTHACGFNESLADGGDLLNVFANVRELTGSVLYDSHESILMGRSWADSPKLVTLAEVWTMPRQSGSFLCGLRCARTLNAPR